MFRAKMKRPAKSELVGYALRVTRRAPDERQGLAFVDGDADNLRPAIFSVCFTGAQPGGRVAGH